MNALTGRGDKRSAFKSGLIKVDAPVNWRDKRNVQGVSYLWFGCAGQSPVEQTCRVFAHEKLIPGPWPAVKGGMVISP